MKEFKISDVKITQLKDSWYVIPLQLHFKENGKSKSWDLIRAHDSVAIIIFNTSRNVLVCVKQFRPAVYINSVPLDERANIDTLKYPAELGLTLEFCAGIVDKPKSLKEIAQEEIMEECGYKVPLENIHKIVTFRVEVGENGSLQTLFYTEVTDVMKTEQGGGNPDEDEYIEIVELTIEQAKTFLEQDTVSSPGGFLFGLLWFFQTKADKYVNS
ncbi:uridine diphosphate glucose pyrophosphatase NUDT14-like [Lycorma delicatula]|uniref:uridine diphosphate glucose pyrophosphatase NUDT14-like n=1 Tax=Lycorma delicatula TaxID=130591 RepID=UPI003F5106B3